ncbi:hypothetical protein TrVE_jg8600 [Triparma verrucosa]|uniref:Uncharacterized protein n=1 Tax=Triparma verrucosa TaxID=1606542 RepID=A0A9W7FGK1_9STRA|nr:hypothetical protein TrVE_jg8600 [Triparma verrucosa]
MRSHGVTSWTVALLLVLLIIPDIHAEWWPFSQGGEKVGGCSSHKSIPNEESDLLYDVAIVGCGATGVQAALYAIDMNLTYVVLERSHHCGSFFDKYPRRGDLISFNKPNTPPPLDSWSDEQALDYKLKFDWHSMLKTNNDNSRFPTYTNKFYPRAEVFTRYIDDVVSSNGLNALFNASVAGGKSFFARNTLLATGLESRQPSNKNGEDLKFRFPNAKFYNYDDAPIDNCEAYTGKYVVVFGNGNAATELSTFIVEECAATRTWVIGKKVLTPSHMSHYVGNVRTHNMAVLESYQLKSLDVVTEESSTIALNRKRLFDEEDIGENAVYGAGDNIVVIYSGGFKTNDGIEISVDGNHSASIFKEENLFRKRYLNLGSFNEIADSKGIFALGAISHGSDYKESSGGFVHGFRYTVETTMKFLNSILKEEPWPYKVFEDEAELEAYALARIQTSSALWHLQAFYGDVVIHPPGHPGVYLYIEQIPVSWEFDVVSYRVLSDYQAKNKGAEVAFKGWTTTLENLLFRHFSEGEFLTDKDLRGEIGVLRNCKTPKPKITKVKEGGKTIFNRQNFDDLPLIEKCLPMFFERFTILVDGVKAASADLAMKLRPGQQVHIKDTVTMRESEVSAPQTPTFGIGRMVLLFQYGDNFKGCEAVYDKGRAGEGFITPSVYLETDPRQTLWSGTRGGEGSENLKKWVGWDKVIEIEDLMARWRKPKVLPKIWERYFYAAKLGEMEVESTYVGEFESQNNKTRTNLWLPELDSSSIRGAHYYKNEFGKF